MISLQGPFSSCLGTRDHSTQKFVFDKFGISISAFVQTQTEHNKHAADKWKWLQLNSMTTEQTPSLMIRLMMHTALHEADVEVII